MLFLKWREYVLLVEWVVRCDEISQGRVPTWHMKNLELIRLEAVGGKVSTCVLLHEIVNVFIVARQEDPLSPSVVRKEVLVCLCDKVIDCELGSLVFFEVKLWSLVKDPSDNFADNRRNLFRMVDSPLLLIGKFVLVLRILCVNSETLIFLLINALENPLTQLLENAKNHFWRHLSQVLLYPILRFQVFTNHQILRLCIVLARVRFDSRIF